MKKKQIIFGFGILLLLFLLWFFLGKNQSTAPYIAEVKIPPVPSQVNAPSKIDPSSQTQIVQQVAQPANEPLIRKSKQEEMRELSEEFDNRQIEFYGKVVDQNGNPVSGVKVKGNIATNKSTTGYVEYERVT